MRTHAKSVWEAVSARGNHSPHAISWRRCVNLHGLDPEERRRPQRVSAAEMRLARERAAPVIRAAVPEMDRLFETFGKAGCCLILTDACGLALERRGDRADDRDFETLGLWQGTLWDEAAVGTNGIGTALAECRSVGVYRDKHFLAQNTGLSCASAPVRDHRGQMAGILDISSARYDLTEGMLAVLLHAARESASQIETVLFRQAYARARIVLAPGRGGQAGLLALDRDDIVIGANAAARKALNLDDAMLAAGVPAATLLDEDTGEGAAEGFDAAERRAVRNALAQSKGNVSAAAQMLGISRATLHRKIKRLDLR